MKKEPVHYVLERNNDGSPKRLVWSPEIQQAIEEEHKLRLQREAEEKRRRAMPMACYVAWAEKHGLLPK